MDFSYDINSNEVKREDEKILYNSINIEQYSLKWKKFTENITQYI